MKPPPFLLGATLLFWGFQTEHLLAGAAMGALLESGQWVKARWEFTDQDFRRIWVFCALLLLAVAVYAFTATGGPGDLISFLQNPNPSTEHNAGINSARAVAVWLRSLPMVFLLFVLAQTFNTREGIPPETISLLMHWRWQKARKQGQAIPHAPNVNVSYAYFGLCLFSACFRARDDSTFFWGLAVLLGWALWKLRSRRFKLAVWAGALAVAVGTGYFGQVGVARVFRFVENYNPQWFGRSPGGPINALESKTALGSIGRLKTSRKIIIRLEPKDGSRAPGLLRAATYRTYENKIWFSDIGRDRFEPVVEETNHTSWVLLRGKTNVAAVNIACYLPGEAGVLPLPTGCARLEDLPAFTLQKSALGTVVAEGPGLVIFDALYGPGDTADAPPDAVEDLRVPSKETNALNKVIAELHVEPFNRKQAMRALAGLFDDPAKFHYSTWQGFDYTDPTKGTPLSQFLLRRRAGHCEYFATATVLLLRQLGIPARYSVGYAVHESSGTKYVVRQRDAHAWCLVWNEAVKTWQDFDTTPASWVAAESRGASLTLALSDLWSLITFEISKFRWGQTHLRQYILWALAPILALLLYQIIFRSRRRHDGRVAAPGESALWPGLDSEFYRIEQKMGERGAPRRASEPMSAWLARVLDDPALREARTQLCELLRLHYRYRFDPRGLSGAERKALRREAEQCLALMGRPAGTSNIQHQTSNIQ
ncbi:MAG TPA: DUF4129 domain-containing transglutaminase family protein [Candidatus Acidoferrum sp.]|nr:DUF4129 domain-containing transglutaminase family protein [Candidatus Acidoferrum sp.]